MPRVVAVEASLRPFRERLERDGYRIVGMDNNSWRDADAIVISGQDENLLNFEARCARVPG